MGGRESKLGWAPETFHDGARRRLMFWGGVSGEGMEARVVYWGI